MLFPLILFIAPLFQTQEPPSLPAIRFTEPVVEVAPAPSPDAVIALAGDAVLVVDSDVELLVWSFPANMLNVAKEAGPIKLRAKFAGGTGRLETRTFKGKCVVIVEATGTGEASLLVVPAGAASEQAGIVKRIAANQGAKPPPDVVPPIPTAKAVYIAVVRDPRQVSPEQAKLLTNTPFWDAFKASGSEWDIYSNTSPDAIIKGYVRVAERVQVAGQPYTPALVILNKTTGDLLSVTPLPRDMAGVVAELQKVVKP